MGPHASSLIQPLVQAASFGQARPTWPRGGTGSHPALAEVVENALLQARAGRAAEDLTTYPSTP